MSRLGGGSGSLSGRFQSALAFDDDNKPDSDKHLADLGSPKSPLRTRPSAATHTSSSSSSSGSLDKHRHPSPSSSSAAARRSGASRKSHSGELTGSSDTSPIPHPRPGHRRSGSGPLLYSAVAYGSTATSPNANALPTGNICPSGRIAKASLASYRSQTRTDVLGSGTGNYGHGSIIRSGPAPGNASVSSASPSAGERRAGVSDPQEITKLGNEHYKKGQFAEALRCYDGALEIWPGNAACRSNRAAALTGLRRLGEAVRECREAVRLDHTYGRAHHRLATLLLRFGQVENAQKHLYLAGHQPDLLELQKIQSAERHLGRCAESRTIGDWKSALREADAAIAAGADSCPMLVASRGEALLRLNQLDEAEATLLEALKLEAKLSPSCFPTKFFGMISDSYMYIVRAKVDMALGRFESALAVAEKARQVDSGTAEVMALLNNVRSVVRARAQGNEFFKSGDFAEASTAYGEGLKYDPANPVLHCNRAACRSKLGQWERAIDDCNEALRIQPSYKKALLRRAASFAKLERWADAVRDYEVLRKELPGDTEVAESLFHAQVALKRSRGKEVSNMKFGGEVEEITCEEQFQAAISLPGVSVVHFMAASNQHCAQISPFVDSLCTRFPSLNFLKVDVIESPTIAKAENVRIVPTFKIYKNSTRVKEMICPSQQVLEYSVRHYGL